MLPWPRINGRTRPDRRRDTEPTTPVPLQLLWGSQHLTLGCTRRAWGWGGRGRWLLEGRERDPAPGFVASPPKDNSDRHVGAATTGQMDESRGEAYTSPSKLSFPTTSRDSSPLTGLPMRLGLQVMGEVQCEARSAQGLSEVLPTGPENCPVHEPMILIRERIFAVPSSPRVDDLEPARYRGHPDRAAMGIGANSRGP